MVALDTASSTVLFATELEFLYKDYFVYVWMMCMLYVYVKKFFCMQYRVSWRL